VADVVAVAEVRLWGHLVGAVAEDADRIVTFEYSPDFARLGLEISPIHLPLARRGPVTFPELSRLEAFGGLPGVLADSLPDRFGNAVIRRYFANRGESDKALSLIQKLLYLGTRGMGALEFRPAIRFRTITAEQEALDVAQLVAEARQVVEGRADVAVPHIMRVGASAGGARPKAVILWNRAYNEVRSGYAEPRPGDQHWIIKFDGVGELGAPDPDPQPYNRIEYVYARMARTAGIAVPEMALLRERRLAHFLTRRFDRVGEARRHMHTLGGMHHADYNRPGLFSYEQYLRTVLRLNLGYGMLEEAYRRAVFNVAACNQDDHVKNFSFLMDETGAWTLAPAYDLTYARGQGSTRVHQLTLGGKSSGLTRQDLLRLGAEMGIRRDGADVIRQVTDALGSWEAEAREAGVPAEHAARIAGELMRA
jgi:serine/threonine-protein kinase HipA